MKKIIKIQINIENQFGSGFRGEMDIHDMIFTEYTSLLNYDHLLDCYKKAIKKLNGFSMLTATLLTYEEGMYRLKDMNTIKSFRYTNDYGEVKRSELTDDCYNNFVEDSIKTILPSIKHLVERGNKEFIELLKSK